MKTDDNLTVPAAARRLGFTLKYLYDLLYCGRLKAKKVCGRWQIPLEEIEALEAKRRDR